MMKRVVVLNQTKRRLLSTTSLGKNEDFLSGGNSVYADEMYRVWKQDPSKVHAR